MRRFEVNSARLEGRGPKAVRITEKQALQWDNVLIPLVLKLHACSMSQPTLDVWERGVETLLDDPPPLPANAGLPMFTDSQVEFADQLGLLASQPRSSGGLCGSQGQLLLDDTVPNDGATGAGEFFDLFLTQEDDIVLEEDGKVSLNCSIRYPCEPFWHLPVYILTTLHLCVGCVDR